jgi:tetratricopeptide (TPR) repeat protein
MSATRRSGFAAHPSEDEIGRFLTSRLDPADEQRVARHVLAGCGACSRKLVEQAPGRLLDRAAEGRGPRANQDPLRERALAAALRQEDRWRTDAKKLELSLELLRESPGGYDGLTVRQAQALHGRPLIEALLARSRELRYQDPRAMRWLAYNAVQAAGSLRPAEHGPPLFDLQARAWTALANAYKVNYEFAEAEGALTRARALRRRGSGDLQILAHLAAIEASLRSLQGRLIETYELLDRAYRLHMQVGDHHLAGEILIAKGATMDEAGTSRQGIPLFRKGLALLDPDRDPRLVTVGQQGLINLVARSGDYRQAGELLLKSGLRQAFGDAPIALGKLRWLEGKILAGVGKAASAERVLLEVRSELLDLGRTSDAALVGLDLISILLQQGKLSRIRGLARESYDTLRSLGILRQAARIRPYLQ